MDISVRKRLSLLVCAAFTTGLSLSSSGAAQEADQSDALTLYRGALVWDGKGFTQRDLAVRAGVIVEPVESERITATVDLDDAYVTPPLSDAHNHVTQPADWSSNSFLSRGMYYVWNPTTIQLGEGAADYFARPDTFDVKVSYGGITEPRGHPEKLYVEGLSERVYGGRKDFLRDAFHYGRNQTEIEEALDLLVEQGADFVKGYLLYSEQYEDRVDNDEFYGAKGLNPGNAAILVDQAAQRGLKVTFHVETAADLVVAAEAGAFAAMHLPAYGVSRMDDTFVLQALREDQAKIVADSGMLLVPTYLIARNAANRVETGRGKSRAALAFAIQRHNLALLDAAGAKFLIGTDGFGTAVAELEHLASLGVLDNQRLLQIAFATGPRLFPDRRIGCLDVGCEADFLVLEGNPLEDLSALKSLSMRVKAGQTIE